LCATLGVKTTYNANEDTWVNPPTAAQFNSIATLAGGASCIDTFEGPNEYNFTNIPAGDNPDWDSELENYHQAMFSNLNNSTLASVPLLAAPLGNPGNYPTVRPELCSTSDADNMHSYPGPAMPTGSHRAEWTSLLFDRDIPVAEDVGCGGRDLYSTETGYTTIPNHLLTVNEAAKSRYLPRLSFEYFNAGIERGFLYQLLDHKNVSTLPTSYYGIIDYSLNRKASFRPIENMIDIVDVADVASPGSLGYEITGALPTTHSTLLAGPNGTFYLAMWQEVRSYDYATDVTLEPADDSVTIEFEGQKTIKVYPVNDIASSGSADDADTHPSRTVTASSITEPIEDEVKIFRIG